MLSGISIISTVFLSKIFLKKKIELYKIIACAFAAIGFIILGVSVMVKTDSDSAINYSKGELFLGLFLGLLTNFLSSC